jgi:UDP-3-O-acyl N-acetylglucosamine deacetylase
MVEHALAALYALEIDNCEIAVNAAELPGCDGSCQAHVVALLSAGIETAPATRKRLVITDVTRVGDDDCWVEARPNKKDELSIEYKLDYGPNNPIGRQKIQLAVTPDTFVKELSTARTFLLEAEARWLRERGMGTRVTSKDLLVFGDEGVIDNELRFEDECVRHKALDLVGDLALCGCELVGQVIAYKSGHRLNAELVQVLLTEGRLEEGLRRTG